MFKHYSKSIQSATLRRKMEYNKIEDWGIVFDFLDTPPEKIVEKPVDTSNKVNIVLAIFIVPDEKPKINKFSPSYRYATLAGRDSWW